MKMYLISDNIDSYTGMRLAGVEGAVVHEKQELKAEIDKVLADKEIGILLLTEKFGRDFPDVVNNVKLNYKHEKSSSAAEAFRGQLQKEAERRNCQGTAADPGKGGRAFRGTEGKAIY